MRIRKLLLLFHILRFDFCDSFPLAQLKLREWGNELSRKSCSIFSSESQEDPLEYSPSFRQLRANLISQGLEYGCRIGEQKVSRWAHQISSPEVGCVILDSGVVPCPDDQKYFKNAVILIVEHDEETGTVGLILNRPTKYLMGEMVNDAHLRALPGFEKSRLFFGGDVGINTRMDGILCVESINLIHEKEYSEATQIMEGLYYGGLKEALNDVQSGNAQPEEFKFFTKYCGWSPGQLDDEIENGIWVVVATDTKTILDQTCGSLPKDLWREIMFRLK
mmetsp:Transcript_35714/g.47117  ORF Transcript_35714/g.47117 Transcript_35714/m.47117 type:complete len:277 (-) Transcript_35714:272-1102(-)